MPQTDTEETGTVKIDLKKGETLHEMFYYVKNQRGFTINAEVMRVLVKEEYDRLHKVPFLPSDDPLVKKIEGFIASHPELGFKDTDEFLRSAARRQIDIEKK